MQELQQVLVKEYMTDLFKEYPCWQGVIPAGYVSWDFLGIKTDAKFFYQIRQDGIEQERYLQTTYPAVDEEYFEWLTLLKSIKESGDTFRMFEIGAGWGRWICRAAKLCDIKVKRHELFGLEPDKQHFEWMKQHLEENNVKGTLINAMMSDTNGQGYLTRQNPYESYGQCSVSGISKLIHQIPVERVETRKLSTLLENYKGRIDLLDMDIQGEEFKVLSEARKELSSQVKRVYVETHSKELDGSIFKLFNNMGWFPEYIFYYQSVSETSYGEIKFTGGVQVWVNKKEI